MQNCSTGTIDVPEAVYGDVRGDVIGCCPLVSTCQILDDVNTETQNKSSDMDESGKLQYHYALGAGERCHSQRTNIDPGG